jgi:hypothetical protein
MIQVAWQTTCPVVRQGKQLHHILNIVDGELADEALVLDTLVECHNYNSRRHSGHGVSNLAEAQDELTQRFAKLLDDVVEVIFHYGTGVCPSEVGDKLPT